MPPRRFSRYTLAEAQYDDGDRLFLITPTPFRYQEFDDTTQHVCADGDTLWGITGKYLSGIPRACGRWDLVGMFQPEPIFDPTVRLEAGRVIYVPSARVIEEEILAEKRRNELVE